MYPPPHIFYGHHPSMMGGPQGTAGQAGPQAHPQHHGFPPFYPPPPHYFTQPTPPAHYLEHPPLQKSSIADKSIGQESSLFDQFNNSQDQVVIDRSQKLGDDFATNQQFQNLSISGAE